MIELSLSELSAALESGTLSSEEVVRAYLDRIAQHDTQLNSLITVTGESAIAAAQASDRRRAAGTAGPLAGIPIVHKDVFCTRGVKTSCGSRMLDNFIAPYDATVVERSLAAGMVMLGKSNMDEFAMGSSNENSYYGPVCNPWDPTRVPGGSSGGSAAAVAARLTPVATGTDTGGSIRQPAALCGITGIKPTYGRVSRHGLVAFASSLDQAGGLGHSAQDVALLLHTMAGFDERDSTSADRPVEDYPSLLAEPIGGLKAGLPKEYFAQQLDEASGRAIEEAIRAYEALGVTVRDISLPNAALALPAYYVVAPAECSSNLSRFDGVRYGYRTADASDLSDLYERSRGEAFGEEVKRRIMIGTYALSTGYYDAYYLKAQQLRRMIRDDFCTAFETVDIIIGPTTPGPAFEIGERSEDPLAMYSSDIYTLAVNLAGLPAISVPVGFADGLPVGLQLIGNYFDEARLLNAAHQYQLGTDWHKAVPPGFD